MPAAAVGSMLLLMLLLVPKAETDVAVQG